MFQFKVKPLGCATIVLCFVVLICLLFFRTPFPTSGSVTTSNEATTLAANPALAVYSAIPPNDPAVAKAIKPTDAAQIEANENKEGAIVATVQGTETREADHSVTLNFTETNQISAVAKDDELPLFPDLNALVGRRLLIKGEFRNVNGKTQIRLYEPSQIRIVTH